MLEVKITAASIDELADKMIAMGHRLVGGVAPAVDATEAPAKEPATEKAATKPVTKAAAKPKEEPKTEEPASEGSEEVFTDYDRDVVPIVLATIKRVGRDAVVGVLDEYGVSKADQIADELWPELVTKLRDLV